MVTPYSQGLEPDSLTCLDFVDGTCIFQDKKIIHNDLPLPESQAQHLGETVLKSIPHLKVGGEQARKFALGFGDKNLFIVALGSSVFVVLHSRPEKIADLECIILAMLENTEGHGKSPADDFLLTDIHPCAQRVTVPQSLLGRRRPTERISISSGVGRSAQPVTPPADPAMLGLISPAASKIIQPVAAVAATKKKATPVPTSAPATITIASKKQPAKKAPDYAAPIIPKPAHAPEHLKVTEAASTRPKLMVPGATPSTACSTAALPLIPTTTPPPLANSPATELRVVVLRNMLSKVVGDAQAIKMVERAAKKSSLTMTSPVDRTTLALMWRELSPRIKDRTRATALENEFAEVLTHNG